MEFPWGIGWQHDPPDIRDQSPVSPSIMDWLQLAPEGEALPEHVDLREYFFDALDQQSLNSSCAHACIDLYQYFQRRCEGKLQSLSRMFLYKNARTLLHVKGNVSVDLRTTLRSLAIFGCPPEDLWPYKAENLDVEPPPLLYSFADEFRAMRYVRLDRRNETGRNSLATVKAFLAAGFPVAFGFMVPRSLTRQGDIPYRPTFDSFRGGQAVLAVGYDDRWLRSTRGALLIRNSWGRDWGEEGYAWLPYAFVENQIAVAFWTILREDWMRSGELQQPWLTGSMTPEVSSVSHI